jgi:hypothetical protein
LSGLWYLPNSGIRQIRKIDNRTLQMQLRERAKGVRLATQVGVE